MTGLMRKSDLSATYFFTKLCAMLFLWILSSVCLPHCPRSVVWSRLVRGITTRHTSPVSLVAKVGITKQRAHLFSSCSTCESSFRCHCCACTNSWRSSSSAVWSAFSSSPLTSSCTSVCSRVSSSSTSSRVYVVSERLMEEKVRGADHLRG